MAQPVRARWRIEDDPATLSYGDSRAHALYSAIVTLTLAVLGSTILPLPYAMSKLGVIPGCATLAIVAYVNDCTCVMLVRAAAATQRFGFEALAEWAGGKRARMITQVSLILLLYGTMCGGLAFLSDVAKIMVLKGIPPPSTSPGQCTGAACQQQHTLQATQAGPGSPCTASGLSAALRLGGSSHQSPSCPAHANHYNISSLTGAAQASAPAQTVTLDSPASINNRKQHGDGSNSVGSSRQRSLQEVHAAGYHDHTADSSGEGPDAGDGSDGAEPWWLELMRRDGRPVMLVVVLLVLYPLCLQRHIRQFERAATVGVIVVIVLMSIIIGRAVMEGFPAVKSGELPFWGFRPGGHRALPEAFAICAFALYMQPMLMPVLAEMPGGSDGRRTSELAVHVVLYGVACSAYGSVGVFGASIFGSSTESNIMVNDLLPGNPTGTLVLYGALMIYLCCGMVTTQFALRKSLEVLLFGPDTPYNWPRWWAETTAIICAALAVACSFPTMAEKIFALTGCTAICIICYCVPVYIHVKLKYRLRHQRVRQYNHSVVTLGSHSGHTGGMARAAAAHALATRAAAEKLGRSKNPSQANMANGNRNGVVAASSGATTPNNREDSSSPVLVVVESAAPWLSSNPPLSPLTAGTPPSSRASSSPEPLDTPRIGRSTPGAQQPGPVPAAAPTAEASTAAAAGGGRKGLQASGLRQPLLAGHEDDAEQGGASVPAGRSSSRAGGSSTVSAGVLAGFIEGRPTSAGALLLRGEAEAAMAGGWMEQSASSDSLLEGCCMDEDLLLDLDSHDDLLAFFGRHEAGGHGWGHTLRELMLPLLIITVGVGSSIAGLWVAAMDLRNWLQQAL